MARRILIASLIALSVAAGSAHAADDFSDIPGNHIYAEAISHAKANGISNGFSDGTFRPDRWVNRAEALKMIAIAKGVEREAARCDTQDKNWIDVPVGAWYESYVCFAAVEQWIQGYDDGTFKPAQWINLGEVSALFAASFVLESETKQDDQWFAPFVRAIGSRNAIPTELKAAGERVTRGQFAEMLWRISQNIQSKPAANPDAILTATCEWVDEVSLPNVDMQEVNRAWNGWISDERVKRGLARYELDKQLSRTATLWSQQSKNTGTITHKRNGQTAYYDYKGMINWFETLGLTFGKNNGTTFTEAIGWGVFRCGSGDCTGKMIDAIRTTFDFYMSEEGKASRPHFNAIVSSNFTNMGVGIVPDTSSGKYYLTMHVGVEREDEPDAVCP